MKLDFEIDSDATLTARESENSSASTNDSGEIAQKLAAGIEAARRGDFAEARILLVEVSEAEPQNEAAWLWLASISQYPDELLVFLSRVLSVNPGNERALQWSAATKSVLSNSLVQRGIEAARENQNNFAEQCFLQAIAHENENETALNALETVRKQMARRDSTAAALGAIENPNAAKSTIETSVENDFPARVDSSGDKENILEDFFFSGDADENLSEQLDLAPEEPELFDTSETRFSQNARELFCPNAEELPIIGELPSYYQAENASTTPDSGANMEISLSAEGKKEIEVSSAQPAQSAVCPFCAAETAAAGFVCETCGAIASLSDLESLLARKNEPGEVLRRAVEKMAAAASERSLDHDELKVLGIGEINLKRFRKGFSHLQEAARKNPNDVVLGAQVNAFAIRLVEIEEQSAAGSSLKSKKILVVDDSATVRRLISDKLEKCGHAVVCAIDGKDALEKIGEILPDLILLDIAMPQMDGYQVCKAIRADEKTRHVPVVMISGKDGFFDKVRGRLAGTTGYITKPFGPDALMKAIESFTNENQESD